jgi:hypothetical protein
MESYRYTGPKYKSNICRYEKNLSAIGFNSLKPASFIAGISDLSDTLRAVRLNDYRIQHFMHIKLKQRRSNRIGYEQNGGKA